MDTYTLIHKQSQLSADASHWRRSGGSWKRPLSMGRRWRGSRKPTDLMPTLAGRRGCE
jgi:hypothetical protein